MIKRQIRILAIDDSALINDKVTIIGAFFRGGEQLDGVLRSEITRDGMDATDTIIRMVRSSKHYGQIRVILLDGITYAGFNPVDIGELFNETGIPVIVFMRSYPDLERIKRALENLPEAEKRWEIIQRAGRVYRITNDKTVFIQLCGIDKESAFEIIRMTSIHSNIPEPLRVAHLIATGVVLGESTGKA
ncbi:hypothetical protein ANME2D_01251 [Candidatus Methanoperedens nitroreducens]|uniref:UPF0215 protein ANME2D_01251 n=1 Tax=Candidatus Methanoperedens nitratireducens TaxID=1392998 RepID=A0A062V0Z9_9EURY|nr:DUF99 family protein [Candidatus Methanoperedens nitroreducens]KCZ72816.1 hypothetical protein ANME2D_01251 [Candidatus Methanoperedens nitroreducens]MDJ1423254.1 DUF99 family protein [Candidatus Methanoperedens sp.]